MKKVIKKILAGIGFWYGGIFGLIFIAMYFVDHDLIAKHFDLLMAIIFLLINEVRSLGMIISNQTKVLSNLSDMSLGHSKLLRRTIDLITIRKNSVQGFLDDLEKISKGDK